MFFYVLYCSSLRDALGTNYTAQCLQEAVLLVPGKPPIKQRSTLLTTSPAKQKWGSNPSTMMFFTVARALQVSTFSYIEGSTA